ncbi:hypothetical protein NC651_029441 [Populus alba x Populus x berolinensis]|nr:hypothetical protein NC651_029441 [Populus alba x Populus x berolinensis]
MAAVGGHNKAAHSSTLPLYGHGYLLILGGIEGVLAYYQREICMQKLPVKPKKHSPARNPTQILLETALQNQKFLVRRHIRTEVRFSNSWKRFSLTHLPSFIPPPVPKEPKRKSRSTRENTATEKFIQLHKSTLQHFTFAEHQNGQQTIVVSLKVYKGCKPDVRLVAIKQLTKGTLDEKTAGFLNELGIIAQLTHSHTAKLLRLSDDEPCSGKISVSWSSAFLHEVVTKIMQSLCWITNDTKELADPSLGDNYDQEEMDPCGYKVPVFHFIGTAAELLLSKSSPYSRKRLV